jgi:hypothetical protein
MRPLALIILYLLCACAPLPEPPPPPPPPPNGDYGNGSAASTTTYATRLFTPPSLQPPDDLGAVALIVFPTPPSTTRERSRYRQICLGFLNVLGDSQVISGMDPGAEQMVTLWPRRDLDRPRSFRATGDARAAERECDAAINQYSYEIAGRATARLPVGSRFPSGKRGPFLIAWAPPRALGDPQAPVLTMDLSDFEHPEAVHAAFRFWRDEITRAPESWRNGWTLTRLRLQAGPWLDRHGERILGALKVTPGLSDN